MVKLKFSKKMRLLTTKSFAFVFKKSKRVSTSQIIIIGRINALGNPRVGFAISKKTIKHAHERNRIKRLVRESFRLHQYVLPAMDFIVIAKKGTSELNNKMLSEALEKLWYRHCRLARAL